LFGRMPLGKCLDTHPEKNKDRVLKNRNCTFFSFILYSDTYNYYKIKQ